ncbi:MAG: DNA topoisomerase IB [Chloroflexota bacterium]|nr:DNA topoisomerase IB [Chloroflexota bacterium]
MQADAQDRKQENAADAEQEDASAAGRITRRGWRREGTSERGFRYVNAKGEPIRSAPHLQRIESLRIPPAWEDVRISTSYHADLQATGFDDAGRKQYLYHPDFVARQAARKFSKLGRFAKRLSPMREVTSQHLRAADGPEQRRIMATLVRLINEAYFRVGSEEYVKRHKTYGITTLLKRHVQIEGETITFRYKGKKGVRQSHIVVDEDLHAVLTVLMDLPGARVFKYLDEEGESHVVNGHDLNAYIREVMGPGISAKDFRTWAGTLLAAEILADLGPAESERQMKQNITETVRQVAEKLGNTPAVARSSYISPVLFERYAEGKTLDSYTRRAAKTIRARQLDLEPEELALVRLLGLE